MGLYLGDGHIISKPKQHHLSIFCTASWPGLIDAAEEAMRRVMPMPSVRRRFRPGCAEVKSFTEHWTCMFPQHGPGKKHEREIALEPWQQSGVDVTTGQAGDALAVLRWWRRFGDAELPRDAPDELPGQDTSG
ncbi:hypothetical protein [Streptomyces vilmorinianum]|uniref:hypothetical protein n=1 Tax=Streptomyces vilmorinianum TaxID=3051092 RepID=UPI0032E7F737